MLPTVIDYCETFAEPDNAIWYLQEKRVLSRLLGYEPFEDELPSKQAINKRTRYDYSIGAAPKAVRAVDALWCRGITFPLESCLPRLARMWGHVLFSGSISRDYMTIVHAKTRPQFSCRKRKQEKNIYALHNAVGRLLYCCGLPDQKYVESTPNFSFMDELDTPALGEIAKAVLQTRKYAKTNGQETISLPEHKSRAVCKDLGERIELLFDGVGELDIHFDYSQRKDTGRWSGVARISKEERQYLKRAQFSSLYQAQ